MKQKIRNLIAATLGVAESQIPADAALGSLEQWDSLGHLELMMALEMEFQVKIPADRMFELTTVEAIQQFVEENGAAKR